MKFELRVYQRECIDVIKDKFNTLNSQLIQLPTGSGKTVILWHFLREMNKKALIIAPTKDLVEQLFETGCQVVKGGSIFLKDREYWKHTDYQYYIMTHLSAASACKNNLFESLNFDYVIVDEAHRSQSKTIKSILSYLGTKGTKAVGLTATPERLDGKSLLDLYADLTYEKTFMDLIDEDHLCDIKCYKVKTGHSIKDSSYKSKDLTTSQLKCLDIQSRNQIIIDTFKKKCRDTKTLIFCLNIEHSKTIANLLALEGFKSAYIDGSMSKTERKNIIRQYKEGSIEVLCNCQLLTEGFDEPSIQSIILGRPTRSKALYCQMIGRGVRPYKGKDYCYIYDMNDTIHNICDFNVLGAQDSFSFEVKEGESLKEASKRNTKRKVESYDWYEHKLYDKYKKIEVMEYQLEYMDAHGIPVLMDISFDEAQHLIFKNRQLEKHGIHTRTYWRKWKESLLR